MKFCFLYSHVCSINSTKITINVVQEHFNTFTMQSEQELLNAELVGSTTSMQIEGLSETDPTRGIACLHILPYATI